MSASISEQLKALPLLSTVLRIDFELIGDDSAYPKAESLLRTWVDSKFRNLKISPDWIRPNNEFRSETLSLEHARSDDAFAFILSERDNVGREWITEVAVKYRNGPAQVASRLSVRQPRSAAQPAPRAPRFIGEIARTVGINDLVILETRG